MELINLKRNPKYGDMILITHDPRPYFVLDYTSRGIWCRPAKNTSPKNILHVAFKDVIEFRYREEFTNGSF
jgi:hypothetical protein